MIKLVCVRHALDVLPPDEDAGVHNNSAFTNSIARRSFLAFDRALDLTNTSHDDTWRRLAENVYLPLDEKLQYHPEYDGYMRGKTWLIAAN